MEAIIFWLAGHEIACSSAFYYGSTVSPAPKHVMLAWRHYLNLIAVWSNNIEEPGLPLEGGLQVQGRGGLPLFFCLLIILFATPYHDMYKWTIHVCVVFH